MAMTVQDHFVHHMAVPNPSNILVLAMVLRLMAILAPACVWWSIGCFVSSLTLLLSKSSQGVSHQPGSMFYCVSAVNEEAKPEHDITPLQMDQVASY
jgi:hypothetical protein